MRVEAALRAKHGRIVTARLTGGCMVAARRLRSGNSGVLVAKNSCGTEGDVIPGVPSERNFLRGIVDHAAGCRR